MRRNVVARGHVDELEGRLRELPPRLRDDAAPREKRLLGPARVPDRQVRPRVVVDVTPVLEERVVLEGRAR